MSKPTLIWAAVIVSLAIGGCYRREAVCVSHDCDPVDDAIPEFELDPDPGASGDADGDGMPNSTDTDDDDDGIADDVDVDIDGDGLLERAPSADTIEAAWTVAYADCELEFWHCMEGHALQGGGTEDIELCQPRQFAETLVELAQVASLSGATRDPAAWQAEQGDESPGLGATEGHAEMGWVEEKGGIRRLVLLDEIVLPYFHGTTVVGEPCFTRWDCEADARCDGLVPGSGEPGTCGVRPKWGGACGTAAPYCPPGAMCTVLDDGSVCEAPRYRDEFCRVFELGGRLTDNCDASEWCDDTIETPACRPMLGPEDSCTADRQCWGYACLEASCLGVALPQDDPELREQCQIMFPTAQFWPAEGQ